ncbi:MAG: YggS family pyridoxal phosphate-dependent enzyme [Solirubrobacterales bacterium]
MSIKENINCILSSIPKDSQLIAVTKTRSVDEIREAYDMGLRDFGENKVQELISKYDEFDQSVRWHLIGHLQRNKVKYIVGKVYLIHSLDSVRLLQEIDRQYKEQGLTAEVLIEINIGREENKTGILLEELEELITECENCSNVKVKGLMTVLPVCSSDEQRKYFKIMKELWDSLGRRCFKNIEMKYLSMGMTGDYKMALLEGANMIRVGEGIFGKRNYNK